MPEFDFHDDKPSRVLRRRLARTAAGLAAGLPVVAVAGLIDVTAALIVAGVVSAAGGIMLGAAVVVDRAQARTLEQRRAIAMVAHTARELQIARDALARILAPEAALTLSAVADATPAIVPPLPADRAVPSQLTAALGTLDADAYRASAWLN